MATRHVQDSAIALVGIDVDGTLVGSSGEIPEHVWEAAARARRAGVHLALCSGRPAFGIARDYAQRLETGGWHIFQNGASVVHLATGETRSARLPQEQVQMLIQRARASDEVLELYGDSSYVAESTHSWAFEHAKLLGVPFEPRSFETLQEPVVRAQWLLSVQRAAEFKALPHPGLELAQSSSPLMPQTQFVGLTRAGVSKGVALQSVARQYAIPLAAVMYVGDSGNDLSALQIVGWPIAMGNADAAVRAVARHTVGHVDEGGVAQALEMAVKCRQANP
ncbi:MAG: Cof-type HAD-IIB family hydrolase [Sinobacteraceae bacterium]|nr:Cof-type HAD-IIB family hydrolase [Nevskiaceae bacterium]MBV8853821.1 Cof-type HAD-IIB family hydrolase [Nevskiaceae bacterium]